MRKVKLGIAPAFLIIQLVGSSTTAQGATKQVILSSGWSGMEDSKSYAGPGPGTSQPRCTMLKTLADGTEFQVDLWLGAYIANFSFVNKKWQSLNNLPRAEGKSYSEIPLTLTSSHNGQRLATARIWQSSTYSPPGFFFQESLEEGSIWLNSLRGSGTLLIERQGQPITTIDLRGYPQAVSFVAQCVKTNTYKATEDPFAKGK